MKKNLLLLVAGVGTVLLASCNGGSTATPSSPTYASVSVPMYRYVDGSDAKFAVYINVGESTNNALAELDTGSEFVFINESFVGPNVIMTGESISYPFQRGTDIRTGMLGYAPVTFMAGQSGMPIIGTSDLVPIIVAQESVISPSGANNAIVGLRMNNNVSAKLFLPYPYNQMFIFDGVESQLIFGNFSNATLESYGVVTLQSETCQNLGLLPYETSIPFAVPTTASTPCWNDMAVPITYIPAGTFPPVESTLNSLLDSGASSSFQYDPLPSWLTLTGSAPNYTVTNPITAVMTANMGGTIVSINVPLSPSIAAYQSTVNGGIVNVGNNVFNYYPVVFNQANGTIGINNN